MRTVRVVGAGFTGLVAAYYLAKRGLKVEVFEKTPRVGGLIQTHKHSLGLIETAANGILNSYLLEDLFSDLNLAWIPASKLSKKRYIYRKKPKRWPLTLAETFILTPRLIQLLFYKKSFLPLPDESIEQWGARNFSKSFVKYVLTPALQGIYAGDPKHLSANLIIGKYFKKHTQSFYTEKTSVSGLVTPKEGMGALMNALKNKLSQLGVDIHLGHKIEFLDPYHDWVICTSLEEARRILKANNIQDPFHRVQMLPLVTVTAFFDKNEKDLNGFGCLFSRDQGVRSLGVLFNQNIFYNRSTHRSETWILGGSDKSVLDMNDGDIVEQILKDRAILTKRNDRPLDFKIQRWPQALPHYSLELERALEKLRLPRHIHLLGNYKSGVGLNSILQSAYELSLSI